MLRGARRKMLLGCGSVLALAAAEPAWAQCTTTTASGVTTITCGNTVTVNAINQNENNPSTTAYHHRFANTINATIAQGVTITGRGLLIQGTGNNPVTVTNNGVVSHSAGETANGQPVHGLEIAGNGGLVTYLGNGSATTNATPPGLAAGLSISNGNGGGINIGSQAAPVTGTFSGETAFLVRAPSGSFISAWFNGGTFTSTNTANDAIELSGLGNVNLVMTGQSVLNGSLNVGVFFNAPDASIVSANIDARITETLGPAVTMSGVSGGTNFTLGSAGAITGQAAGVAMFAEGGEIRITTAAGSTINATGAAGLGVQLQPDAGTGSILADFGGTITSGGAGLFLAPANGNANVTIRAGASISGNSTGISVLRLAGRTGIVDILNLGTISSPNIAADFDGTLRIGNGGTTGTISGNIINRGTLIFNRSDAIAYAGIVSGTGALTKQGAGTLTLSGVSTYTGATNVSAGTLLVTGAIASAVTVGNGATLGGTGTVGTTNIASGGTLSPGLSIGTLAIAGNLAFATGSSFLVEVAPASADRVNVTGAATLAGTLTALSLGGTFTAGSQYTLLTATGGLTGTFGSLVTQGSFNGLVPTLSYAGNSVLLTLSVGGGGSGSITTTTSQTDAIIFNAPTITVQRVGLFETRIIGRLAGGVALFDQTFNAAFGSATVVNGLAAARAAITTGGGPGIVIISDPVLTSRTVTSTTSSASIFSLAGTSQTVTTTVTLGPGTITTGDARSCGAAIAALPSGTRPACGPPGGTPFVVAAGTSNVNTNTRTDYTVNEARTDTTTDTTRETYELTGTVAAIGTVHAAAQSGVYDLASRFLTRLGGEGSPGLFGEAGPRFSPVSALAAGSDGNRGWAEAYGFRNRADARGGVAAERRDAWGLAAGFSLSPGAGIRLGFGVDHGRLDLAVPGAGESADVELTQIAASARFGSGPFGLALAAVHGFGSVDSVRTLLGLAAGSYDVNLWGAAAEASYLLEAGAWRIVPRLALDFVRIESDAFAETGALGLSAPSNDRDRTRASAGLEIGRSFAVDAGGRIDVAAWGRYVAVLGGEERTLPIAFNIAPGAPLVMRGLPERDSVALGAQLGIQLTPRLGFYAAYDGRFASGYDAHGLIAGLRLAW